MVDFDNETTIGTPAIDIVRVLILQSRYNLFEAFEAYIKQSSLNVQGNIHTVRARLVTLFLEIQATLKRKMGPSDYKKLYETILGSPDEQEVLECMLIINEYLDSLGLTKIDTKIYYDKLRVEHEHRVKKL